MLNEPVLIDTGAFAALFDPRDQYHAQSKRQFIELPVGKSFTCWPVITEAAYLSRKYPGQRDRLLDHVAQGSFLLLNLDEQDIPGIQHVLGAYSDQAIDLADAALVYLANREGIRVVFTFDRRHFQLFRRSDGTPFQLIP